MNTLNLFTYGLAQFFGLFLFIFSIILFTRREYYSKLFLNMREDNPVIMLAATIGLFVGIILVATHGSYITHYRIMVTFLCWVVFIKSLFWLMIPEKMLGLTKKVFSGRGLYVLIVVIFTLGFLLLFRGSEVFIVKYG